MLCRLNLELRDNQGRVPLWLALSYDDNFDPLDEDSLAAKLVFHGASCDTINTATGERNTVFTPSITDAGPFFRHPPKDPKKFEILGVFLIFFLSKLSAFAILVSRRLTTPYGCFKWPRESRALPCVTQYST